MSDNRPLFEEALAPTPSLDPEDWQAFRRLAHEALDDAIEHLRTVRDRPVWQQVPETIREALRQPLPVEGCGAAETYRRLKELILPYSTGNTHPRFFGWVHGTGTPGGVVAEMMAAAMNCNCGGRDHAGPYVERCVLDWCKQMIGYPESASGILLSGTSMGSLAGLAVARDSRAGWDVRRQGLPSASKRLTAYVSSEGHYSIAKAADLLGVGSDFVRKIPVDGRFQIELPHLREAIQADRAAGLRPFCVVGSAGTVNTGAIDDLRALASLCQEEGLWYHVDGAFGALAVLDERSRPLLDGMQESDSIAFDFHKWMHVPYDAGCLLVRDSDAHWRTFSTRPAYLQECERGLAGGGRWFCELGPELSRGFRALKVWFTLMEHGVRGLGASIRRNCDQARYLGDLVRRTPDLELLAEPSLNIVCFRFRGRSVPGQSLDDLNRELVADLQEMGVAAPSTTHINGRLAVRVNITNHRTRMEDLDLLVSHAVELGRVREARGE